MKALLFPFLLLGAAAAADANPWPNGVPVAPPPPPPSNHGFFTGDAVLGVDREYVVEREIIREVPGETPAPPAPPPPPRKPFVLGRTYASLPGPCMKLIEGGETYFQCSGEWYRQVRDKGAGAYVAVAQP